MVGNASAANVHAAQPQQRAGGVQFIGAHHQAAGENPDRPLKDTHVYVQFKAGYTLFL